MHSFHDSSRIGEDRELRSEYIRELVQEAAPIEGSSNRTEIPKVIVQFWHDLDAIPGDVQECVDSWEPLIKRGFTRVLFDNDQARRFIAKTLGRVHVSAFNECHHPAMRCDYFRLCYIFMQGGFYIDADELYQGTECSGFFYDNRLKIQPLCYDTGSGAMISTDVFVRQRRRSPSWIYYVNNNPIIAPAYHPVIRSALDRSTRILLSRVKERADIQSTTGPGNLTASLVKHCIASEATGSPRDFVMLFNWETTSISRWPLSYRNDKRNWRLWSLPHCKREEISS